MLTKDQHGFIMQTENPRGLLPVQMTKPSTDKVCVAKQTMENDDDV